MTCKIEFYNSSNVLVNAIAVSDINRGCQLYWSIGQKPSRNLHKVVLRNNNKVIGGRTYG
jgi:hypothetical protein